MEYGKSEGEDLFLHYSVWDLGWEDLNSWRWPGITWMLLPTCLSLGLGWLEGWTQVELWIGAHIHMASSHAAWRSSQHGSLKVLELLTWQLQIPRAVFQWVRQTLDYLVWPSLGHSFHHILLVRAVISLLRVKERVGYRPSSGRKEYQSICGHICAVCFLRTDRQVTRNKKHVLKNYLLRRLSPLIEGVQCIPTLHFLL